MTRKERILAMIQRLEDDVSFDEVIYKLEFLQNLEEAIREADQGLGMDHDEFMAQLEAEDAAEQAALDAKSTKGPARDQKVHRPIRPKKLAKVRAKTKDSSGKS